MWKVATSALSFPKAVLGLFFLLMTGLCAVGAWHRMPFPYLSWDEFNVSVNGFATAFESPKGPHYFWYPPLAANFAAVIYKTADAFSVLLGPAFAARGEATAWGRYYSSPGMQTTAQTVFSAFSFFAVLAWGLIARSFCDRWLVVLLPFWLLHLVTEFVARTYWFLNVDMMANAFAGLALYTVVRFRHDEKNLLARAVIPAALSALSLASKYQYGIFCALVFVSFFLWPVAQKKKAIALAGLTIAFTLLLTVPQFFIHAKGYWEILVLNQKDYAAGNVLHAVEPPWRTFYQSLGGLGSPVVLALAALGAACAFRADRRLFIFLALGPAVLFAVFIPQGVFYLRNVMPLVFLLAICAAIGAVVVGEALLGRKSPAAALFALGILVGAPALSGTTPFGHSWYLSPDKISDSRKALYAWIVKDLPANATIAVPRELDLEILGPLPPGAVLTRAGEASPRTTYFVKLPKVVGYSSPPELVSRLTNPRPDAGCRRDGEWGGGTYLMRREGSPGNPRITLCRAVPIATSH